MGSTRPAEYKAEVTRRKRPSLPEALERRTLRTSSQVNAKMLKLLVLLLGVTLVLGGNKKHGGGFPGGGNFPGGGGFPGGGSFPGGGGGIHGGGGLPGVGGIGGPGGGSSSNCRYWCRTPENQAYCCESGSEFPSDVYVKPGKCPPVRPECPATRFGPPKTCSNDGSCAGSDKCCYDRCLSEHVCKPPLY